MKLLYRSKHFQDYSRELAQGLEGLGAIVRLNSNDSEFAQHATVLVGLHSFSARETRRFQRQSITVGVQTEQLASPLVGGRNFGSSAAHQILPKLRYLDLVIEWHRSAINSLEHFHRNACWIPHGGFEPLGLGDQRSRTFDVLFVGHAPDTSRRAAILDRLRERYTFYPASTNLWGNDLIKALRSSKILLNLHFEESLHFESPRFFLAASAGIAVVSEPVFDSAPFRDGRDFISSTKFGLVQTIDRLLSDVALRESLARSAQHTAHEFSINKLASRSFAHMLATYHSIASPRAVR